MALVSLFGGLWASAIRNDVLDVKADLKAHLIWSQTKSEELKRTETITEGLRERVSKLEGLKGGRSYYDPSPPNKGE